MLMVIMRGPLDLFHWTSSLVGPWCLSHMSFLTSLSIHWYTHPNTSFNTQQEDDCSGLPPTAHRCQAFLWATPRLVTACISLSCREMCRHLSVLLGCELLILGVGLWLQGNPFGLDKLGFTSSAVSFFAVSDRWAPSSSGPSSLSGEYILAPSSESKFEDFRYGTDLQRWRPIYSWKKFFFTVEFGYFPLYISLCWYANHFFKFSWRDT